MATLTQNMIQELNTVDFLTTEQAAALAKQAFADYSKRSNAAKAVNKAVYDMILAGGCPNSVFNAVEKLVAHYA
jgi:anaerobic ribonucleoside-triphosphate reductase